MLSFMEIHINTTRRPALNLLMMSLINMWTMTRIKSDSKTGRIIMLLIISDGGNLARETSRILDKLDANYLFHFSSFSNAGFLGKGNAVVGKMSYRSLCRIIDKNNINCVVDIINAPKSDESLVALNVAEDLKLPLIKLIPPTLPFERSNLKRVNIKCDVDYSYESVASKINNTVGNIVFFFKTI